MNKIIAIISSIFFSNFIYCQDAIFTQYFASQPYLNPALTGFYDGSYRINAHYRTQWTGISSGVNTYGVNGEIKFGDHEGEKDYVGAGIGIYRDDLYGRIADNTARLNFAYHKRLGYGETKHYLSIGTNIGMDYRQVNQNLIFPDVSRPIESKDFNKFIPNLGLGLNYQIVFPSFANVFLGGGVDHLVSENISILNSNIQKQKRITIYSSARLKVNEAVYMIPTFLTAMQGPHKQINFGAAAQLLMREYYDNKANFQIGVYGRLGNEGFDALIGMFRYENRGIQVGLSYDHALTELSSATGGFGALELSLGYIGFIEKVFKSRAECPNLKNF